MLATDEDAVICDLAETYHIYDYRALPVRTLATLCAGLRPDARIKMKMAGMRHPLNTYLLAGILDRLSMLVWAQSKDARPSNKPKSILEMLMRPPGKEESKTIAFDSPEDFEAARRKILSKGE